MDQPVIARLERLVTAALVRSGYSGKETSLVVGVSGGPDSSALLYCLHRMRERRQLRLHVAHLNHDFRGEEAEVDARFVATVAQEAARQAADEAVAALTQQEAAEEDAEDEDAEEEAAEEEEAEITEQEVSWWSTIWPFFFLAIVFFALEVILLLAIRESDGSVTALIKDVVFVVLYVVLLLAALPGD